MTQPGVSSWPGALLLSAAALLYARTACAYEPDCPSPGSLAGSHFHVGGTSSFSHLGLGGIRHHQHFSPIHRHHFNHHCDDDGHLIVRRQVVFFSGVPAYYGYYGPYGAYDPYLPAAADRNARLRRQLQALADENEQLRRQGNDKNRRAGGVAGPRRKSADQARRHRAGQLVQQGIQQFRHGRYSAAAERFRTSAGLVGDDATPQFLFAHSLFAARRYPDAVAAVREGLSVNRQWLLVGYDMKGLYDDPDELLGQLAHLAGELQANPLDRDRLFLLGFELLVTGQPEKARPVLEQVARLEPDDSHVQPFFDYFDKSPPES